MLIFPAPSMTDPYLDLPLTADTQDLYTVRTVIRQTLRVQLPSFHGTFLDIGSGLHPYRGRITVPFLWPLHDVPYDEYRYTPFALRRLLEGAGFTDITVRPLGGWDASLAQLPGLWALRRPMPVWKRRIVKLLTQPLVRHLLRHDHVPDPRSVPMITGLMALAHTPRV